MRSDLIFSAIHNVPNRFLLARVLAKATREFHRPGTRIQDTTNEVLERFGCANPIADGYVVRISATLPSRRNRPKPAVTHRSEIFPVIPIRKDLPSLSEPLRAQSA